MMLEVMMKAMVPTTLMAKLLTGQRRRRKARLAAGILFELHTADVDIRKPQMNFPLTLRLQHMSRPCETDGSAASQGVHRVANAMFLLTTRNILRLATTTFKSGLLRWFSRIFLALAVICSQCYRQRIRPLQLSINLQTIVLLMV